MANNAFVNVFRIKELRDRILFTIGILIVFRLGSVLTIPGIDPHALSAYFQSQVRGNAFVDYMDFFVGGAFSNFSVFMLGVMPYISTQILMQLALFVFPSLKKIAEDDGGRKKIQVWTRILTVFVALIQSYAVTFYAYSIPGAIVLQSKVMYLFVTMLTVTTGTMITVWLGEQITARGIGNGVSMIIFAGIIVRLPHAVSQMIRLVRLGELNLVFVVIALIMFVGIIVLVVYEQQGQRKIPVHYAKRVVGRKMYGGQNTYIPFKINPSGVIPIIFASSFLTFPISIATTIGPNVRWLNSLAHFLRPNGWWYNIFYLILIVFFAYFYASIAFNAKDISENLKRQGGFIPGIRPGEGTAGYLNEVASRLTFSGAIYLGLISTLPWVLVKIMGVPFYFGGTSVLIVVSVALDTMRRIEAQIYMNKYQTLSAVGL